jgi:hypothetical protein
VRDCYEHANEPSGSMKGGNFLTSCVTVSFLRRTVFHGVSYLKLKTLIACVTGGWLINVSFSWFVL